MVRITLLPHQVQAVDWLLSQERGILADKPGLGKTYPSIVAALTTPGPRIFVVPSYLQRNWELAIYDIRSNANVVSTGGRASDRLETVEYAIHSSHVDVLLTTYEHLRMHWEFMRMPYWGAVLFDEAHKLRGRGGHKTVVGPGGEKVKMRTTRSQQGEAARALESRALYLLTGTPQVRDVGDYFALLHLIDRRTFSSYWRFVERWAVITQTPWGDKVGGCKDIPGMRQMLRRYVLRRDFKDVGIDMPDAVHYNVPIQPPVAWLKEYRRVRNEFRVADPEAPDGWRPLLSTGALVAELYGQVLRLPAKVETTMHLLKDHDDEQVIIWCWRRESAGLIEEKVRSTGRPVWKITGEIPASERTGLVSQFKASSRGVLVATIAALGLGENLQTGNVAIFFEESYLPGDNEQAIGRQRRIGQTQLVRAYHIIVEHTVDVAVHKAQAERGELAEKLLMQEIFT